MRHSLSISLVLLGIVSAAALGGCARNEAAEQKAMPPLPQVTVAAAISRKVTEFDEFTGRFEAVERVEVRPRVSGYISSVNFKDGSEVKKGDVLFVIDPRPNVAERDKARAQLAQARSQLILARSERDRATRLLAQHAISQEEFDTRTSDRKSTRLNSSHVEISYAVFCLKKKKKNKQIHRYAHYNTHKQTLLTPTP